MVDKENFKMTPDTVYWSVVLLAILIGAIIGALIGSSLGYEKGYKVGWSNGVRDEKIGTLEELTPLNKGALNGKNTGYVQGQN